MELIIRGPFPAACRKWRTASGLEHWVIACKATFRFEPGRPRFSARQGPIRGTTGDAIGGSMGVDDLVPFKGAPELLLVGGAELSRWPRRVTMGVVDRVVHAEDGVELGLGPMGLLDARRAAFASPFDAAIRAWHEREIVPVDPHFFNAAPETQWLESLAPGEPLALWNFHPQIEHLEILLPTVRPSATVERAGRKDRCDLRADTLLLDLDARVGMLTFRCGILEEPGVATTVIVECEPEGPFEEHPRSTRPRAATGSSFHVETTLDAIMPVDRGGIEALPFERRAPGHGIPVSCSSDPALHGRIVTLGLETETTVLLDDMLLDALIPLHLCARLAAEITHDSGSRAEVLERAGHDTETFQRSERHWEAELRAESRAGRSEQLAAFDGAFVTRLEELRGPITREDYAALAVARERGRMSSETQERSIPAAAVARIEREWVRRMAGDFAVFSDVERAIGQARQARPRTAI